MTAPAMRRDILIESSIELQAIHQLMTQLNRILQGKPQVVELAVTCLLAGGHLLIEDVPGVGKTTLARGLAKSVGARFSRIQFTSDLLPADILGVTVFKQADTSFEFKPGPIFANIVLADEINRTTPRTQSSLLEAMSEGQISIDDVTHPLPTPFWVIATQNPLEAHGTYPLPDSQLDRFMMRLSIGYPASEVEREILLQRRREEPVESLKAVLPLDSLLALQRACDEIHIDEALVDYLQALLESTRKSPKLQLGVSPRAGLYLLRAARALALLDGREYVVPQDIQRLAAPTLAHRISPGGMQGGLLPSRNLAESIIEELLAEIAVPI